MKRKLLTYPNPKLRQVAKQLTTEFGSDQLKELVQDMESIMRANNGIGLAAIQIGVNKSVIIYKDTTGTVHSLCNARIATSFGNVTSYDEGCLSAPGFKADIKRLKGIKVKAQTVDGKPITVKTRGLEAITLQHEIDHLNGIDFADRAKHFSVKIVATK